MHYYFLDLVPWSDSQSLYHAAAYLGREALFILRPTSPYISTGFHQDVRQEIDLEFAGQMNLPVIRREVGGGAVYLDSDQLFYQLILRKSRPGVPESKADFYQKFLQPVVDTYRQFGIPASFRPVNDILANGRKISGNGAAEIGGMVVLVGNFILDFNYEMMSKVLLIPDQKFRDKVYKTLSENLSSFRRETGAVPETAELAAALAARFEDLVDPFEQHGQIDPLLRTTAQARLVEMTSPEWLFANDRRSAQLTRLKIREDVYVQRKVAKLPGGLVRIVMVVLDGAISDIHLSGDFFVYPSDALAGIERVLKGARLDASGLTQLIESFCQQNHVEIPGVSPEGIAGAIMA